MRRIAVVLAGALMVWGLVVSIPAQARPKATPWTGTPTLISGTARYDRGVWIHTDFVYDDYGADTQGGGQPNVASLASTSGDFRYPEGPEFAGNAADIVEVRAHVSRRDLHVRVLLQTIVDPDVIAIWADAGGTEHVFTAENATVDAAANTVSFVLPGAAAGDTVALNLGAGLHDGIGGLREGVSGSAYLTPEEFTTGGSTDARLFDLAFNTRELEGRGGAWNEDTQSDALAAGALDQFTQTIDVGALRSQARTNLAIEPGYYVRLFESRQDLGEGMGDSFPEYRGRWQPYALWVPDSYVPGSASPLLLSLHSLSVHHNQYRGGSSPTYTSYYEQFGDDLDALVVTPLGRGPDGWYEDEGLVDTLEVWSDVRGHYSVDPARTLVDGYSMGGYGTYRLTTLMPDSFASAVSIVGPPANGIWAYPLPPSGGEDNPDNTRPQLESTRHVPFWITHGVADELVPVAGIVHQTDRFGELGYEYRFALHPAADHLSFAVQDEWSREVAWFADHAVRVANPHQVTLKVRPASWATGGDPTIVGHLEALTAAVGARLDGAYWVGNVVVAEGEDVTGIVDLESGAIARRQVGAVPDDRPGVDGPSPHVITGQDIVWADSPRTNTLTGELVGVRSLTVDVGRAQLSNKPALDITSDIPATITFVRKGKVVGTATIG